MTSFVRPLPAAARQGVGKPVARVEDVEMPATPARVWHAIQAATRLR